MRFTILTCGSWFDLVQDEKCESIDNWNRDWREAEQESYINRENGVKEIASPRDVRIGSLPGLCAYSCCHNCRLSVAEIRLLLGRIDGYLAITMSSSGMQWMVEGL